MNNNYRPDTQQPNPNTLLSTQLNPSVDRSIDNSIDRPADRLNNQNY